MTLYKIFKENEEKILDTFEDMIVIDDKTTFALDKIEMEETVKQSQLAQIDGFIAMVDSMEKESSKYALNFNMDLVAQADSYNQALSDLKDKLLAERKLIEENK